MEFGKTKTSPNFAIGILLLTYKQSQYEISTYIKFATSENTRRFWTSKIHFIINR